MTNAIYRVSPSDAPEPLKDAVSSRIEIAIAADAMSASMRLLPTTPGDEESEVRIEDVLRALAKAGVNFGVDPDVLREACVSQPNVAVQVAWGLAPQEGQDCDFVELVSQTSNRTPKVNADGLIDYREHNAIGLVGPGEPLMRRIPPVPGSVGYTVFGDTLAPREVRDEPFASGLSGSEISANDPTLLQATIAGLPVRVPFGMLVEPVLQLDHVDMATGNVYFDGTVKVNGDVQNGMKVEASGDIYVGGTVSGGQLVAGGNLVVGGGVIADSKVRAGGSVTARFAQSSELSCATVLDIQDVAMECILVSGNLLQVGTKAGERGRLVGGTASAGMLIKVPVLGSDRAALTRLSLGVDPALESRYQAVVARIAQEKINDENLQRVCLHLTSIKDPKGMLDRARAAWREATRIWGQSLLERAELERQRELLMQARVELRSQTDGAVELCFGTRRLRLHKHYERGVFSLGSDQRILFTGTDGKSYPAA